MKCPLCKEQKSRVLHTEKYDAFIERVRRCPQCKTVWRTVEQIVEEEKVSK